MKKNIFPFLLIIFSLLTLQACKKQEGYGGNCAIKGVLKLRSYNADFSSLKSETTLADEYVYIVFEDGKGYGDRVKTSYDGSFSFTHLQRGNYKLYVYSKDTTLMTTDDVVYLTDVKISKNREIVDAGELKTATNVQKPGNAIVRGKIFAHTTTDSFYATNQKVFISYEGNQTYSHFVYTDEDGEYQFSNVPIGNHKIFVYSKDTSANPPSPTYPVEVTFTIHNNNDIIVLSDININK